MKGISRMKRKWLGVMAGLVGLIVFVRYLNLQHLDKDTGPRRFKVERIDDKEILQETVLEDRISQSIKLHDEKVKLLTEFDLLRELRRKPNCTSKMKDAEMCYDTKCKTTLPTDPRPTAAVFKSIFKPLTRLRGDVVGRIAEVFGVAGPKRWKYLFVMGVTENHYIESQGTIESLHKNVFPFISNYTFFYYDMGLSKQQRYMVEKYGNATVCTFPFKLLPPRIHLLKNYTWKPLLVQAHIHLADFVVYMDASVRGLHNFDKMFDRASKTGFLMCPGHNSLAVQTSSKLFSYYGDQACAYSSYTEYESGFLVFHNEPFIRTVLLEPWVACALDPECMSLDHRKYVAPPGRYSKRHRFDQSVLTIMLLKLFGNWISTFSAPRGMYHHIKQGRTNVFKYLEDLQTKSKNE